LDDGDSRYDSKALNLLTVFQARQAGQAHVAKQKLFFGVSILNTMEGGSAEELTNSLFRTTITYELTTKVSKSSRRISLDP